MTLQERAEKIAQVIEKRIPSNAIEIPGAAMALRAYLAAQIEEAEHRIQERKLEWAAGAIDKAYAEGFAAARAQAEGIAQKHGHGLIELEQIADRISKMEPEK